MRYEPTPIDTSGVNLDQGILELRERLAEHAHDVWAQQRIKDGWRPGPKRDDARKEHPSLIPYAELSESEKQYDRNAALETLKAILALGYRIEGSGSASAAGVSSVDTTSDLDRDLASLARLGLRDLMELWRGHDSWTWAHSPQAHVALAGQLLEAGAPLVAYDVASEGRQCTNATVAETVRMRQLQALALARSRATRQANQILRGLYEEKHLDEETLGLLASTHKDLALRSADPRERDGQLKEALKFYCEAYEQTGGYWTGINAATLSLLLGEKVRATALATQVHAHCLSEFARMKHSGRDPYWVLATLGEAAMVLGDFSAAEDWYCQAAAAAGKRYGRLSTTRRNFRLLAHHLEGDWRRIEKCLHIPAVAVFSGHMIDHPGRATRRFPAELESAVQQALRESLKKLDVGFGFSSAACGSDLLFLEALLELGGETHVVLPYERQMFLADSVELIKGGGWQDRFSTVLARATEVVTVSGQKVSSGSVSYDYVNQVLLGLATFQAEQLETELVPLAVWDGNPGDGSGGTASSVERWRRLGYEVQVIELDRLLQSWRREVTEIVTAPTPSPPSQSMGTPPDPSPRIVAILFADAKGFSKLTEEQTSMFVRHFLALVGDLAHAAPLPGHQQPALMNTWGDGLFFVFESVTGAAEFALELCDRVRSTAWEEKGLPNLGVRIGLHVGPAYPFTDPVTRTLNFIGTHISHAARIEPITPPNEVYASQHFAALAALEREKNFHIEYVGQKTLAKDFGIYPMYVVHRRTG